MKRIILKRAMSLGLVFALTFSLAGCNKKGGAGNDPQSAGGVQGTPSNMTTDSKSNVFAGTDLDLGIGGDFNISGYSVIGDKIYFAVMQYDEVTYEESFKLMSMNKDGSNIQLVDVVDQYEKKAPNSSNAGGNMEVFEVNEEMDEMPVDLPDEMIDAEMNDEEMDAEAVKPKEVPAGDVIDDMMIPVEGMEGGVYENSSYSSAIVTEDGQLYAIRYYYYEDGSVEQGDSEETMYLDCWNLDGSAVWEAKLEGFSDPDNYRYVSKIIPNKENGVTLLCQGEKVGKVQVDKNGTVAAFKEFAIDSSIQSNMSEMALDGKGRLYISYYSQDENGGLQIAELNMETGAVGEGKKVPNDLAMNGFYNVFPGTTTDFVFSKSDGIYTYNIADENCTKLMDFINSDAEIGYVQNVILLSDDEFICIFSDSADWKTRAAKYTKVDASQIKDKVTITVAGVYITDAANIKQRVIDFNKNNDEYRIILKDYNSYNTDDDYMAGYTQLNNDIISGNVPDILVGDDGVIPLKSYAKKGLLADVEELIKKDPELSNREFMTNVFDAYRIDGHLYQVLPGFRVQSLMAKSSIVGDIKGWNLEEFKKITASLPEGTKIFGDTTQTSFLYNVMYLCGTEFINPDTGKCDFDSDLFKELLTMAKEYPAELDSSIYEDEDYWMTYQAQYRTNKTLLKDFYLSSCEWAKEDINGYMGEDVSFVGFPSEERNGSTLTATESFSISAKSKNQDAAWQFVRYYLLGDYQKSDYFWGLPIQKDLLLESAQKATQKSYYLDENNQKVEYNDTININGEDIEYSPLSQEQVDELVEFIGSVNRRDFYNEDISNIIDEEAKAFFDGQKSAADVAALIQNRAQLYVNENM